MRIKMKMPDLAATDSPIRVLQWRVQPGQKIERGQAILEVETDKATMDVESIASGLLVETQAQPGDEVSAGQVIAVLETDATQHSTAPSRETVL